MIRLGTWLNGRLRRTVTGMLVVLATQILASGLCAIPGAQAASSAPFSVASQAAMHADCPMEMPATPDQSLPQCDHCEESEATMASVPSPGAPDWALAAMLPDIQALGAVPITPTYTAARLVPLATSSGGTALIFRQTLRIRI